LRWKRVFMGFQVRGMQCDRFRIAIR